jgi:SAM-dependent methyltransferase
MKPKYYPCPVCKSNAYELIYTRGVYFDKIQISICTTCGLVCQNPRMDTSFFSKYYAGEEYYGQYRPKISQLTNPMIKGSSRGLQIYHDVKNYIKKSSKILEIGAGDGANLFTLKIKKYSYLFATEENKICRYLLNRNGIKCFRGDLKRINVSRSEKFDLIILSHVLEHFVEPDKNLSQIRNLLKNDGLLYILVPNFLHTGNLYYQFTLPHIFYFSKNSLISLLLSKGFKIVKLSPGNRPELQVTCKVSEAKTFKPPEDYPSIKHRLLKCPKPNLTLRERLSRKFEKMVPASLYYLTRKLVVN